MDLCQDINQSRAIQTYWSMYPDIHTHYIIMLIPLHMNSMSKVITPATQIPPLSINPTPTLDLLMPSLVKGEKQEK